MSVMDLEIWYYVTVEGAECGFEANTSIKANFVEIQLGWGAPKVNA